MLALERKRGFVHTMPRPLPEFINDFKSLKWSGIPVEVNL
jgi:hypothetical protein